MGSPAATPQDSIERNQNQASLSLSELPLAYPPYLPSESFDQGDLCACLHHGISGAFLSRAAGQILAYLRSTSLESIPLVVARELQSTAGRVSDNFIVDVDSSGATISELVPATANELWLCIRNANDHTSASGAARKTFGRMLQIRSLPPIVALQLLTALRAHFDIELLFSILISGGKSASYIPHIAGDIGRRAFWSFSIKYYYLNVGKPNVYEGQVAGQFHQKTGNLYICRGTAEVALSFSVDRFLGRLDEAVPPAPWRLLVLSCNKRPGMPGNDPRNGVSAFFWAISNELAWARRSLRDLSDQIASLAVPSDDFLFDKAVQESLLFEDSSYTNSRTFFWALQSLRTLNECISSLIAAWEIYDKSSLLRMIQLAGKQNRGATDADAIAPANAEELGALPADVKSYLSQINKQMEKLAEMIKINKAREDEIRSLRDGLFNASAVLEARTTVLQGQNIQILTYISMLFLPATFVTSVFCMPAGVILPDTINIKTFAVAFSLTCGSIYIIILVLALGGLFRGPGIARRQQVQVQVNAGVWPKSMTKSRWCPWMERSNRRAKMKRTGDAEKGD